MSSKKKDKVGEYNSKTIPEQESLPLPEKKEEPKLAEEESSSPAEAKTEYPEEVTFIWNRAGKNEVCVMRTEKIMFTNDGPMTDPREPAIRIKPKNGMHTTSDPEEIKFLKGHSNFNSKSKDGFSILRKLTPKQEIEAIATRHNLSKEDLATIAAAE